MNGPRTPQVRLSNVQQGVIAQNEFAKLVMMGSGGRIELAAPLTDEERRDFEVHFLGNYGSALALQIKSAMELSTLGAKARRLRIYFTVRASRLVNDPLFWYFLAFLNPATMRFEDPTFLIPSTELHAHAGPRKDGDMWKFLFEASMEQDSHDRWIEYRTSQFKLGARVMSLLNENHRLPSASSAVSGLWNVPDLVWATRVRRAY